MMEKLTKLNWLAIVVATIIAQGLGMLWYGTLFDGPWQAGTGITDEIAATVGAGAYIVSIVGNLVMFTVLAYLITTKNISTLSGGVQLAIIVWLGFVLFQAWTNNAFSRPETGFSVAMIDAGYALVNLVIGGAILGIWQKGETVSEVVDELKDTVS